MYIFKRQLQLSVGLCAAALAAASQLCAQNPATTVTVDANANHRAINPFIYGICAYTDAALPLSDLNSPLVRYGGDNTSPYNWQLNAGNAGSDWYFESTSSNSTAGELPDSIITQAKAAGAQAAITVPMIGYIANLGTNRASVWSFSVAKYGAQTFVDSAHPDAGNGISASTGQPITGNNPLDAQVANSPAFQLGWMQHMTSKWGTAANGGLKYYIMDNETGLWHETHRDTHPTGAGMSEIYNDIVTYAGQVKANDAGAQVIAPEEWGWQGYLESGLDKQTGNGADRAAHGGMDYMPWLLQNLKSYDTAHGTKSIDIFSLHWYPQSGEFSNDDSAAMQLIRNKSTRSLWDPSYTDVSWINQVVQLIPRMKGWVSTYYPNLPIAITEYNWGDEANLNGATTLADVLGIFGREGLDMATYWTVPPTNSPAYLARKIYRNYDGAKSTFGDTSCSAAVANADKLSAFAATRASDGALTVMVINKITGSTPVTISLANFTSTGVSHAWQISSAAQTSITHIADVAVTSNAISTTVPSQSITLFVVPKSSGVSIPAAPAGLSATAGNAQVALSWNASSGATSYNVLRSTISGSGYASVATGITPTSYTNTGLTNGTTYFFVVSATNSAGTSGNSGQASATPAASSGNTHTGTWACKGVFTATPSWNNLQQGVAVASNTVYTASFWMKGSGAIVLRMIGSAEITRQTFTATSAWQQFSYTFNSGSNTTVTYGFTDGGGVAGTAYIDDCFMGITTTNLLANPGFESGNTGWYINTPPFSILQPGGGGTAPGTPTGLTATPGNGQVALSWTASSGATSYNVKRSTVSGSGYATVSSPATTSYTNTGLTNGTIYYYVVTAVNASGESGNSSQVSATPSGGNTHGGTWAAKVVMTSPPTWKNLQQGVTVAANTVYTASFWMKGSGAIVLRQTGSAEITRQTFTATSAWQKFSYTFNSGSNTTVTYGFTDGGSVAGTAYIDDCFLGISTTNLLANPGFESGNTVWYIETPPFTIAQNP